MDAVTKRYVDNSIITKVGDTTVSEQISIAINALREEILGGAW